MELGPKKTGYLLSAAKRVLLPLLLHLPKRAPEHPRQTLSLGSSDAGIRSFFPPCEHVGEELWHPLNLDTASTEPGHKPEREHLRVDRRLGPHASQPGTEDKASWSFHPSLSTQCPRYPRWVAAFQHELQRYLPSLLVAWVVAPAPGCKCESPLEEAAVRRHVALRVGTRGRWRAELALLRIASATGSAAIYSWTSGSL